MLSAIRAEGVNMTKRVWKAWAIKDKNGNFVTEYEMSPPLYSRRIDALADAFTNLGETVVRVEIREVKK